MALNPNRKNHDKPYVLELNLAVETAVFVHTDKPVQVYVECKGKFSVA